MSFRVLTVYYERDDVNTALHEVGTKWIRIESYDDPFLVLDNFKTHLYDLVTHINMPKMNGFSF